MLSVCIVHISIKCTRIVPRLVGEHECIQTDATRRLTTYYVDLSLQLKKNQAISCEQKHRIFRHIFLPFFSAVAIHKFVVSFCVGMELATLDDDDDGGMREESKVQLQTFFSRIKSDDQIELGR